MLSEKADAVCAAVIADGFTAQERLRIHRNTFVSTASAALRMTYPVIDRLVGDDCFNGTVEVFIRAHPPASGYLNDYGAEFPAFLEHFVPVQGLPYLADVARFEWALSVAANAPDVGALEPAALAAIDPEQHALLGFEPHPSLSLLALSYPADQIADAVLSGDDNAMTQVDVHAGPVQLAIHRGAYGIETQRLDPEAYRFVIRLCSGEPLGTFLEKGSADVAQLLAEQFANGRLSACRVRSATTGTP
ncbi:MAG: DNA-binding domain-containing protein [Pseudomonadota bacterium]|nr:DNA-binding domain-containing protein [Pseudomonadota bacterium]